jgi:poly-gamma-glutamate capsule biosynthesis protein CapA/YwtB (metallophosphatase superfamily)
MSRWEARIETHGSRWTAAVLAALALAVAACQTGAGIERADAAPDPDPAPAEGSDEGLPVAPVPEETTTRETDEADEADEADVADVAAEPAPRSFTIAASGDILPHTAVIERAAGYGAESGEEYDFRPMFAEIAPILQAADLAICHLEVPLSGDNQDVFGGGDRRTSTGAPLFISPWQLADAVGHAGFDACSTAHNHSSDAGTEGIAATLDALERAGVVPAGTYRTPEEVGQPGWHEIAGVSVAHLSATYGLNVPLPDDEAWMVDVIDVDGLIADAEAARDAGAEFVVVSLHHGIEYQREPSANQRARADALLASDAIDLLLGHHTHVVQPIERVHDQVVVYGLGNLLSNMDPAVTGPPTQDGVVALVEVIEDDEGAGFTVGEVTYVPTWVDRSTHVIIDVGAALDAADLDEQRRAELEASWDRTVAAITLEGADGWGVAPTSGVDWVDRGTPQSGSGG